ncbi:hypothetical protein D3C85_1817840 [compost metagenome]
MTAPFRSNTIMFETVRKLGVAINPPSMTSKKTTAIPASAGTLSGCLGGLIFAGVVIELIAALLIMHWHR